MMMRKMPPEDYNCYGFEDEPSDVAERLLAPRCPRSSALSHEGGFPRHLSHPMNAMTAQYVLLLLWTLLFATFSCVAADDSRSVIALAQRQQDTVYPVSFEEYEAAQVPAKLMALMRMTSQQQQQQQQQRLLAFEGDESEPDEEESAEPLPMPLPMYASKEESKRGSYMSLCHFKICNMGRKRNLRPIPRNRF
ncbi:uncharacterized protein CNMa isoform X2 [Anabrus simplex]|uniref:uncharacterized protein CNMa isoform X2 n=1 Tax=Anabrus simplex TaxID=316456 RepID=UPI0035A3AF46